MNVKRPRLSDVNKHSPAGNIIITSIYISIFGQPLISDIAISMPGIINEQKLSKCAPDDKIDIHSDLRKKINDTVLSLKGDRNGIIHEDVSHIIRPYFSMADMDLVKANDVAAKACLSTFNQIPKKSNISKIVYRSYSVLEKGFSSFLSITIDIEIESADSKYDNSNIKSYINFNSL